MKKVIPRTKEKHKIMLYNIFKKCFFYVIYKLLYFKAEKYALNFQIKSRKHALTIE